MIEKAHKFGNHDQLIGIATIPEETTSILKRPAVLFLNSGLLHRVGPYRLYVDLSRILAVAGFFSMRFDLSGIGDSQFTHEVLSYKEKVKNDVESAMNFIQQKYNYERFILIGLCSGAVNSHLVASVDNRVVGVVLMDVFAFPTPGYYYIRCKPYMANPVRLLSKIRDIFDRWIDALSNRRPKTTTPENMFEDLSPSKQIAAEGFKEMVRRRVEILCIYSGGIHYEYNHANQFIAMFKNVNFGKLLKLKYFENANHTYTQYAERKKLIACIHQWAEETYS